MPFERGAGALDHTCVHDRIDDDARLLLRGLVPDAVFVSARTGEGIDELQRRIAELLPNPDVELTVVVPYDRGDLVSLLHDRGRIVETTYVEQGTRVHAFAPPEVATLVEPFVVEPSLDAGLTATDAR